MKVFVIFFILFFSLQSFSQVGIGTTSPKATLDAVASNPSNPSNSEGILIPRIDAFPATNPTVDQHAMLVFLTTDNTFYYWDNNNSSWIAVNNPNGAIQKIDDLSDGKSDADGSDDGSSLYLGVNAGNADDLSDNKNTGIGFHALEDNVGSTEGYHNTAVGYKALTDNVEGFNNSAFGFQSLYVNTGGDDNTAIGAYSLNSNTSGKFNTALGYNSLKDNTNGSRNTAVGYQALGLRGNNSYRNTAIGFRAGDNTGHGDRNVYIGQLSGSQDSGSNHLFIENTNADAENALIYGEFGTDNTTTDNILRTNSEFQIGVPDTGSGETGYAFPRVDGTVNQLLQTDGSGALNWISPSNLGLEDHDWYGTGTTSPPLANTTNIYTQGKVSIGSDTYDGSLSINAALGRKSITINNTNDSNPVGLEMTMNSDNSAKTGISINLQGTTPSSGGITTAIAINDELTGGLHNRAGIYQIFVGSNTDEGSVISAVRNAFSPSSNYVSDLYGVNNLIISNNDGQHVGTQNYLSGSGNGIQYGSYQSISNTGDATHYGSYNVLSGNAAGEQYGSYQSISNTGDAIHYGTYNDLSGSGAGIQYGSYQSITNSGNGFHYGSYNNLGGAGNGPQYGYYQYINNSGSSFHVGLRNDLSGDGDGNHFGIQNQLSGSGNGVQKGISNQIINTGTNTQYGISNVLSGDGSGTKYGSYNEVSGGGGIHYGVYSVVSNTTTGFAGYFQGRISFGNSSINRYIMPASDGTSGQVLKTDGSGNLYWENLTKNNKEQLEIIKNQQKRIDELERRLKRLEDLLSK